jgi:hypothetical protein
MTGPVSAPVTTPRRAVLVLAVLFVMFVTGTGAVALASEMFRSTTERRATLLSGVERLTVYNSAGNVRLVPSVDGAVHVRTRAEFGLQAPTLIEESTPDGALLQAHCDDGPLDCSVDYTIEVPPDFALQVRAVFGTVTARGLSGRVELEVGSGRVELFDLSGPVSVLAHDAVVDASRLTSASVTVSNVVGDVSLDLLNAPSSVDVHSVYGDLDIAVPAEQQRYRVDTDAGRGSRRVGVGTDRTSAHAITASSRQGSIRIRPTGTDPEEFPYEDAAAVPLPPRPPIPPEAPIVLGPN